MRRRLLALAPLAASMLLACAGDPPPPVEAPAVTIAPLPPPAPPPPPPPPPSLLVIPRAEASPERLPEPHSVDFAPLRSGGQHHALERTENGIVVLSDERGVIGLLPPPTPGAGIRWAGFVDGDAMLIATRGTLHRAATPDDALAGKVDPLDAIDPAATLVASAGKLVVAVVPEAGGAYYESHDGGRHFAPSTRPDRRALVDVAVRSDGVVVAAVETGVFRRDGRPGVRAEARVRRGAGTWVRGPVIESYAGALYQSGDAVVLISPNRKGNLDTLGLDAGGRWIPAAFPDPWPGSASTGSFVGVDVPVARPAFPRRGADTGSTIGGVFGMGRGGAQCHGVACLADRVVVGGRPTLRVFRDGRCAKEHVLAHTETTHLASFRGSRAEDVTSVEHLCDPAAPAERAPSVLVPAADGPKVVRLPLSCVSGEVVGTERASFVHCSGKHRGRLALLRFTPSLVVADSMVPDATSFSGAESASDGTTLLFADKGVWLCSASGNCTVLPREDYLAARPLPEGRALVARRRPRADELHLELEGEHSTVHLDVAVSGNVLDFQVTADGTVRLWTSPSRRRLGPVTWLAGEKTPLDVEAVLVRTDGQTVPDPVAKEALIQAVAAARAAAPGR